VARKRDIDPSLWDHEELNALPIPARYLFIGIISNADDEGRLKGSPRYLKRLVYSYDDCVSVEQVRDWLQALTDQAHVCRYELGMDAYIHLPSWHRWQSINRQMVSKIPPCPEHGACPKHEAIFNDIVSDHDLFSEYAADGHDASSEDETTTGPDRSGPARSGTEPNRTATDTATGPGAATASHARPSTQHETPPPEPFSAFHGFLSGLKGYAPNAAFWAWMAKHASGLDLDAEAAKILDYLAHHPNKNCNPRFLQNWLNGALADQKRSSLNVQVAQGRANGIVAKRKGQFHRTCGTWHEGWDVCPADTDDGHSEAV
jgi:hypothetical protein